jgi:anti-anti-sigma factor
MNLQTSRLGGTFIIRIEGRIDSQSAPELEACLPGAEDARSNLLIDLQEVDYLSSAGIRVLIAARKQRHAVGRRLSCCGVRPSIQQVMDLVGLSAHLDLHASQDAYFSHAVKAASPSVQPLTLEARNKEVVLQFLMAIQFQQFAHLSSLTFEGMTTTHTPSLASELESNSRLFPSSADYSDFLKRLNQSRDIEIVIQSMIAEGDTVAVHNITTHTYKDGRSMTTPYMSFYRVQDGKIVEASHVVDRLHEQSQLS